MGFSWAMLVSGRVNAYPKNPFVYPIWKGIEPIESYFRDWNPKNPTRSGGVWIIRDRHSMERVYTKVPTKLGSVRGVKSRVNNI